jgi:hypothetical protein
VTFTGKTANFHKAGDVTFNFILPADADYKLATFTKTITVSKGTAGITSSLDNVSEGDSIYVGTSVPLNSASVPAGQVITYTATPSDLVLINPDANVLTFLKAGQVSIAITAAENTNYLSATVTKNYTIIKNNSTITATLSSNPNSYTQGQTIDFEVNTSGATGSWTVTASPSQAVSFGYGSSGTPTTNYSSLTFLTTGTVVITFILPADNYYASASKVFVYDVKSNS